QAGIVDDDDGGADADSAGHAIDGGKMERFVEGGGDVDVAAGAERAVGLGGDVVGDGHDGDGDADAGDAGGDLAGVHRDVIGFVGAVFRRISGVGAVIVLRVFRDLGADRPDADCAADRGDAARARGVEAGDVLQAEGIDLDVLLRLHLRAGLDLRHDVAVD